MKSILAAVVLTPQLSLAASVFVLKDSSVEYRVSHPAHVVTATSKESRGKIQCDDKKVCDYLVAVPVKSFDSDSGGRDQHMLEVTKAALNPMVQMKGRVTLPAGDALNAKIDVEITFAGVTKKYDGLQVDWKKNGLNWLATGKWVLKLSDFKIERPALLLVPVDDAFQMTFSQTWQPQ